MNRSAQSNDSQEQLFTYERRKIYSSLSKSLRLLIKELKQVGIGKSDVKMVFNMKNITTVIK